MYVHIYLEVCLSMDQDVYGSVHVYQMFVGVFMYIYCLHVCVHMIVPAFKYRWSRWRGGRDMCTHTQEGKTCHGPKTTCPLVDDII